MQCQFAQELFSDHIADTLDRAQKVSLDNHLAVCGDCREQVAGLREMWAALDTMPVMETPKFFHENIMDRIATEAAKEQEAAYAAKSARWNWRSLFRVRSRAYGMAALVLVLSLFTAASTRQSSLNPITWVVSLFPKAAPTAKLSLQKCEAVWNPDLNGGSLQVTLQADALKNGGANTVYVDIQQAGNTTALKSNAIVTSDRVAILSIPMTAQPAPDSLSVTIKDKDTAPVHTANQTLLLNGK